MSIPPFEGPRTHFVLADVEPKEVMNFGVTASIPVDDAATIEVLGYGMLAQTDDAREAAHAFEENGSLSSGGAGGPHRHVSS